MLIKFIFILAYFSPGIFAQDQDDSSAECKATLKNGEVVGAIQDTRNPDKKICSYTSIPYASPPIGQLRFKAPQPAQAWNGTLNATTIPNWCPQSGDAPTGVEISEDCLYLNVHQPLGKGNDSEGYPVMIWFHGGGFTGGSSEFYTPNRLLARQDIILVVAHYRLGLLGFFSTGDHHSPGNYGLKDQAFSIRWVNENIKAFGGNPNKVTIFGESAGGASVVFQFISPLNKGLIHAAISQSGTALASWAIDRKPLDSARIMAALLGCPILFNGLMVNCVKNVPWQRIVKAQKNFSTFSALNMNHAYATVTPVVEPKLIPGAFITDEPETIMRSGNVPDIPLVIGANKHDGSFILALMYIAKFGLQGLYKDPKYMKEDIVPDILKFVGVKDQEPANRVVASSVELAFLNGVNRSSFEESMPGLVDIVSVVGFKSSVQNIAEILSRRGRQVYVYSFEHHSNNTIQRYPDNFPVKAGVGHGDDVIYLFDVPKKINPEDFTTQDQSFSDIMCDMWLNVATFGNPTPTADKRFDTWLTYNPGDEPYMKLNVTPTVLHGYRSSWRPNGFEQN